MATLTVGITNYYTTWAKRSGTAANVLTNSPDERSAAIAFGVARVNARFGDDVDDSDVCATLYGFFESLRLLRTLTTIDVNPMDEKWLKELRDLFKDLWGERFQEEYLPYQKERSDTEIDRMFPYT